MSSEQRHRAADYLLGELTAGELDRFEAALLTDPDLRAEVERLRPVVSRLENRPSDAWEPAEPPALDIAAIVGSGATSTAPAPAAVADPSETADAAPERGGAAPATEPAEPRRPRRSLAERLGFGWPAIAATAVSALLILAVGIGVGTQLGGDEGSTSEEPVTALSLDRIGDEVPDGASGEVLLTGGAGDQLTLDVSGLDETGDREYYELWLLGDEGELVSLGSFRVPADGSSQIEVPLPVDPDRYSYFDVSIEPDDGSPEHSGRSVLRGLTPS
jgi:anti-sigma-K factor RskA